MCQGKTPTFLGKLGEAGVYIIESAVYKRVMARLPGEKNFAADIPDELFDQVEEFIDTHNRPKKKQVVSAMVKLFLRLPEDVQVRLVNDIDSKEDFVSIMNLLIDKRIDKRLNEMSILDRAKAHEEETKQEKGDNSVESA